MSTPAEKMIAEQLLPHGVTDERVLQVMSEIPREAFLSPRLRRHAYEDIFQGQSEIDWGEITLWSPPRRLGYLWHIRRDRSDATDVELTFVDLGDGTTRLDIATLRSAVAGQDRVFHLAANADVRFGTEHPGRDLEQNTVATHNVLEAMRATGVPRIVFASTGSIYGEPAVFPTPEDCPFPVQTSLYGASKLAAESLKLVQAQFKSGGASYLQVLTAEQSYQTSAIALVKARAQRYADTAALFQSLGGGWWNRTDVAANSSDCCKGTP